MKEEIQNPILKNIYSELKEVIRQLDKRETELINREKEKNYQDVRVVRKQAFIEAGENKLKDLKELINCYLLKYNYVPYKHSTSFVLDTEHDLLVLYIYTEKEKLKIYYKNDLLIVYSITKSTYENGLMNFLAQSHSIYSFIELSKEWNKLIY